MAIVSAATIIAAPPAAFLDWPNLTAWDKSYLKTITPLLPDSKTPDPSRTHGWDVVPGDKIHCTFWGGDSYLEILFNTPEHLTMKGVWHGMVAVRTFSYLDDGEGGTKFTQSEEAKGFMGAVLVVDGLVGGNLRRKFVKFNEDLRDYCEKEEKN